MNNAPRTLELLLVAWLFWLPSACNCQEPPDPAALLEGVESARLQIPPSSLRLKWFYRDSLVTNETLLSVDFDGDLRGFKATSTSVPTEYKTLFDGEKAICYDEKRGEVEFRTLMDQTSDFLFDPRMLGLTAYNAWMDGFGNCIPLEVKPNRVEVVGHELVGGLAAWHVRLRNTMPYGDMVRDYWVDDKRGFRVYRMDWNGVQMYSYYDSPSYPWLPSRVVNKEYRHTGTGGSNLVVEHGFMLLDGKAHVRFPRTRWTLAGMAIKRGVQVADFNSMRVLGFWNGAAIVPELPRPAARRLRWWSYALGAALLCVPVVIWSASRRREGRRSKV